METIETAPTQIPVVGTTVENTQSEPVVQQAQKGEQPLLAGKYKTIEELEKAYSEIQKVSGSLSQKAEVANLLEKYSGMDTKQVRDYLLQQQEQKQQAQAQQAQERIQQNPGLEAYQEVQDLKQQLALQSEEKELDTFISNNPEYAEFRDKILNLGLRVENDKTYEEIAQEYFGKAIAQGQNTAYKKIEIKKNTQATGMSDSQEKQYSIDDLRNLSSNELRSLLPQADISGRI